MTPFQRYLLSKFIWYLAAFLVAVGLNFFLPRLIPGNPVDAIVARIAQGGSTEGEARRRIYETYMKEFGLDKPLLAQFGNYLGNLVRGDLGTSFGNYPREGLRAYCLEHPLDDCLATPRDYSRLDFGKHPRGVCGL